MWAAARSFIRIVRVDTRSNDELFCILWGMDNRVAKSASDCDVDHDIE